MSDEFETWKTKVFQLDERLEALEKKQKHDYNKLLWIKMIPYKEWFWNLKSSIDKQIAEINVELADMKHSHDTWWEDLACIVKTGYPKLEEVLREFIKSKVDNGEEAIKAMESGIVKNMSDYMRQDIEFYKGLLEKLDSKVGSARQTEKKEKLPEPIKACFNCKFLSKGLPCDYRDMLSYKEFIYTTFATGICKNWKEEPKTEPKYGDECSGCPIIEQLEKAKNKLDRYTILESKEFIKKLNVLLSYDLEVVFEQIEILIEEYKGG